MGEEVQDTSEEVKVTGRRDLIGKGALAAAVAAVAGVAMAKPAGAANGMNMVIGVSNSGTLTTQLKGGSTFEVLDGGSSSEAAIAAFQSVSNRAGVYGGASGTVGGVGVWGANGSSQGFGVKGT